MSETNFWTARGIDVGVNGTGAISNGIMEGSIKSIGGQGKTVIANLKNASAPVQAIRDTAGTDAWKASALAPHSSLTTQENSTWWNTFVENKGVEGAGGKLAENAENLANKAASKFYSRSIDGVIGNTIGEGATDYGGLAGIAIGGVIAYATADSKSAKEAGVGKAVVSGAVTWGTTALVSAGMAVVVGSGPVGWAAVGVAVGVGFVVGSANDYLYEHVAAVKDFENGVGSLVTGHWKDAEKDIGKAGKDIQKSVGHATKWLGQEANGFMNWLTGKKDKNDSKPEKKSNSRDNYEKSGRLKIQRGGGYSGGQFIALDSDQVNALASTISSKSSDYAQKLTAINNSIDQEIADKLKEVRSWAMGKLGQYNYLTADDVDEILANFTITYDAGAVSSSNQKIKTLAQNLAQVSTGLQTAAKTMSSTDDAQAQGFKPLPSPVSNLKYGFK
ncbi:MAG: hypothetical protein LBI13_08820 [Streptococcaceae bacterium]|jgi:hypothetical protein|nr:hypothetical protein [Streptococcaceae bacterium]